MKKDIKKIAIVRLSALGDIINGAVVLQFIKKHYPNAKVDWIVEEIFSSALQNAYHLNNIYTINLKKLKKEKKISLLKENVDKLKSLNDYDIVIDMQGLIKSAIVSKIISKNNHGFDKYSTRESFASIFYKTTSHIAYKENVIKRNCFVVSDALGFQIDEKMINNKKQIFKITKDFKLKKETKILAFVIGASWKSKIYPKELVVEVLNKLEEDTYIIWGNEDEKNDAQYICQKSKYAKLAPKLSLNELISFISQVDLLIGNDTGPTHIAWAQNVASITLFGPTNQRMIYETNKNIAIKSPSKVNILKIDKNDFSIKEIKSNLIVKKAKELLYGI